MEWISIEKELPEDGEWVLTYQDDGYVCNGLYQEGCFSGDSITEKVTHWMPLPPPPK